MRTMKDEMQAADPFGLERFVIAQSPVFDRVLAELKLGRKRTHWMWFVFPQLRGLGHSPLAQAYGIGSLEEARAYLAHPLLGPRLVLCTQLVLALESRSLAEIFGSPDDLKFRSSVSLFALATKNQKDAFHVALRSHCDGRADLRTVALLDAEAGEGT